MSKTEEIKVLFEALPAFSQQALLDDLLQDFEVQGKVLDLAYQEISTERSKKPCPYCKSEKVLKRGKQKGVQMYECKSCVKWYSETTGTPLWDIKLKTKWQGYLRCMEQGKSLKAIADELEICIQTSFNWRHKILSSLGRFTPETLSGEVESDEFEISISKKGSKILDRKPRKRGTDFKRNAGEEITVIQVVTAVERGGNTFLKAVETKRLTTEEVTKAFDGRLSQGTTLFTDAHPTYKSFAKENPSLNHKTFIAKDHVSKTDKKVHVQTVNHTHRELKDFLRQFNGVSSKYLQNYLNLFAYAEKLRESKHTIKQWLIGALLADNAYNLYLLFQQNAVNIRI
jgi:transposase-like protein